VLIVGIVHALPISSDSCESSIIQQHTCNIRVIVPRECKSPTLNLTGSNVSTSCSSVEIYWKYPMNNLTVIIETPFTEKHQPYSIRLQNQQLKTQISHIYQVCKSSAHTELKSQDDIITVKSNEDYQIILEFQAPTKFIFFGAFIKYDVIEN